MTYYYLVVNETNVIEPEIVDLPGEVYEVLQCGCLASRTDFLPCTRCAAAADLPDEGFIDAEFEVIQGAS